MLETNQSGQQVVAEPSIGREDQPGCVAIQLADKTPSCGDGHQDQESEKTWRDRILGRVGVRLILYILLK
jgi:hypothetical protein